MSTKANTWCPFSKQDDHQRCGDWCKLHRNGSCAIVRMADALEKIAKQDHGM